MAINLKSNYQKRLGLPGYSSHSFSAEIQVEINSADDIPTEISRLYQLLQHAVDQEITEPGYIPSETYGMETSDKDTPVPGNVLPIDRWQCSDKQRELILKLVDEHDLEKDRVDELATQRFGRRVKALDKLQASGLIEELFEMTGKKNGRAPRRNAYGKGQR